MANEEVRKKHCPFLNDWCIKDRCALYQVMSKNQKQFGLCAYNSMVLLLSEINAKTVAPVAKPDLILPSIGRG